MIATVAKNLDLVDVSLVVELLDAARENVVIAGLVAVFFVVSVCFYRTFENLLDREILVHSKCGTRKRPPDR